MIIPTSTVQTGIREINPVGNECRRLTNGCSGANETDQVETAGWLLISPAELSPLDKGAKEEVKMEEQSGHFTHLSHFVKVESRPELSSSRLTTTP